MPSKPYKGALLALASCALLTACATQPKPIETQAPEASIEEQEDAQRKALAEAPEDLRLKRKIAIGRFSNETMHGRSLLRDNHNDPLGKQVSDMLTQKLIQSGQFIVLERPDISRINQESDLTGIQSSLVGVDSLIIGSLIEFGRSTTGTKGFWSKSKKQSANAKVALRLVDVKNGRAYFSATGAGQATTETGEIAFAGSTASYDGSINDTAINNAIADVVDEIISNLNRRPWSTYIIGQESSNLFISGGKTQGITPGLILDVKTRGKRIKSAQTGFEITLPGEKVASIKVQSTFGDSETNEGAVATLISGSLSNQRIEDLEVVEHEK